MTAATVQVARLQAFCMLTGCVVTLASVQEGEGTSCQEANTSPSPHNMQHRARLNSKEQLVQPNLSGSNIFDRSTTLHSLSVRSPKVQGGSSLSAGQQAISETTPPASPPVSGMTQRSGANAAGAAFVKLFRRPPARSSSFVIPKVDVVLYMNIRECA